MKVIFIVDGNVELGMGHIYQSITVAKELVGSEILFLSRSEDVVIKQIKEAGFKVVRVNDDKEKLSILHKEKPDVVIIDKLNTPEELAREIKENIKCRLFIFTNLSSANKYADVVVGAIVGGSLENNKYKKNGTLYFNGVKYFILRDEFYEYHNKNKMINAEIKKILLLFGGSDPANLTELVLNELVKINGYWIDVILGEMYQYRQSIMEIMAEYPYKKITLHLKSREVAKLMYEADLALVSPGLSSFEALCVGTPIIAIPQLQYQWDACYGYLKMLKKEEIDKLEDMIERRDFTYPDEPIIKQMEIGMGKQEIIAEILKCGKN